MIKCAIELQCLRVLLQKMAQMLCRRYLQVNLSQAKKTVSTGTSTKGSIVTRTYPRRTCQQAAEAKHMKMQSLPSLLRIPMVRQQQSTIKLRFEDKIERLTAPETRQSISTAQSANISPEMVSLMWLAHKRGSVIGTETRTDIRTRMVAGDIEMMTGGKGTSLARQETEMRTGAAGGIDLTVAGMTKADDDLQSSFLLLTMKFCLIDISARPCFPVSKEKNMHCRPVHSY